jgi:hypothetical protein
MVHSLNVIDTTQFNVKLLLHFSLEFPKSWFLNMFFTIVVVDLALSSLFGDKTSTIDTCTCGLSKPIVDLLDMKLLGNVMSFK